MIRQYRDRNNDKKRLTAHQRRRNKAIRKVRLGVVKHRGSNEV